MKRIFVAVALLLFSASPLSGVLYQKQDYIVPQTSLYIGELIFIQDTKADYYLGAKKFSRFGKYQFAVAGLKHKNNISIYKVSPQKTSFYEKLFAKNSIVQKQTLKFDKPKLNQNNHLRLPTNVWKKVNKKDQLKLDRKKVKSVLNKNHPKQYLSCLDYPLRSTRVSKFASPRTLPNGYSYFHSGLDLRSRSPEPIKSMGSGQVVLSEHMTAPGNMVIVHHGEGLFSRYMHLSRLDVNVGDHVSLGQRIGLSGRTGRVEGPHLHWEIIWKGNHANPEHFLPFWNRHCPPT